LRSCASENGASSQFKLFVELLKTQSNLTNYNSTYMTYTYDDENRLTSALYYTYWKSGFWYDGLGRLRTRIEYYWNAGSWWTNTTTRYIYDGMRVIQERNEVNTPQVSYTRGNDWSGSLEGAGGIGGLLARSHGYANSNGNWYVHNCYHADGNGNITYLVNSSQTLAASYRYDPYGNTISSSGSLAGANVYRFPSKEQHAYSLLYYYGYRWYSPSLQRWLNRDPLQELGGINLYRLASNDPLGRFDPWGDQEKEKEQERGKIREAWDWLKNTAEAVWIAVESVVFCGGTKPAEAPRGMYDIWFARTNLLYNLHEPGLDVTLPVSPPATNPVAPLPPTNRAPIKVPVPVPGYPGTIYVDPSTGKISVPRKER
jgi:RHS repeat-associated protein